MFIKYLQQKIFSGCSGCFLASVMILASSQLQAQSRCLTALEEADDAFELGKTDSAKYHDTIRLLRFPCSPENLPLRERKRGYTLLVLSYFAVDSLEQAEKTTRDLLTSYPDFEPKGEQFPEGFTKLVVQVKEKMKREASRGKKKSFFKRRSTWIGTGVVVSGAIAYLIFKPEDPKPLGLPPDVRDIK